jgi:hypothetical protein
MFFLVVRVWALSGLKATWVPSGERLAHISRIIASPSIRNDGRLEAKHGIPRRLS